MRQISFFGVLLSLALATPVMAEDTMPNDMPVAKDEHKGDSAKKHKKHPKKAKSAKNDAKPTSDTMGENSDNMGTGNKN